MTHIIPKTIMHTVYAIYPALAMQVGIKLDIFTLLSCNPMDAAGLAESLTVSVDKLIPLLYAMATAGLLKIENGLFSNTEETETYLVRRAAPYKEHICFLMDRIWNVVSKTAETITKDEPLAKMDWSKCPGPQRSALFDGQYAGSLQAGKELGEKIDFRSSTHILDAAGGSGGLAVGLCGSYQHLHITVADLPKIVPLTRTFIARSGMADRVCVVAADVVQHPPDGMYDAAVLRSFFQVLSQQNAVNAMMNIRKVIRPDGLILIIGHFLDDTRLFPPVSVFHNLMFLNQFEEGRAHTEGEYREWLTSAGFEDIMMMYSAFSDGAGLITARRKQDLTNG